MKTPEISVIIATYNSAATLRTTFVSLECQTNQNFEVIVVDGNSSDATLQILSDQRHIFGDRLKWISEPDKGLYDAMNKGIAMTSGDVIGILNSDDFYTSNDVLARVAKEIMDVDAVYGDVHFVHPDNLDKCVRYYSSKAFRPWMMKLGFMPAHPSFYCRKEVYERFGTFDISFRVAADFENLLRLIYLGKIKTKYVPMDFVTMRTGGASTSGMSSHRQILRDHMRAYRKNNIFSNYFYEGLRYAYKVGELIKGKLC